MNSETPISPKDFVTCRTQNPDIPRAGRVRAAHGGVAGRGGAGQGGTQTDRFAQDTTVPRTRQGMVHTCPERFLRSTNKRNPMKTDGGTKLVFDPRFISGTRSALHSWLLTSEPSPFCLSKPSCKACPGTCRIQKPGHTTGGSSWSGAQRGGGARRVGAGRDASGSVRRGNNGPSCPPGIRRTLSWTTRQKHEQAKSCVNRRRTKPAFDPRLTRGTTKRSSFLAADQ